MPNTNSCASCDRTKVITLFGKELEIKDYICSPDGITYRRKPSAAKLQLSICPTSYCSASCPFCMAKNTKTDQKIDLRQLETVLRRLKEENIVRGVTFTGGEPFTDVGLLNESINMVFDILGLDCEISVTTNGTRIRELHKIERLSYLDALHISRHHYDDAINQSLFGVEVPTAAVLQEMLHSVTYRDLFVLNCMMLKSYINSPQEAHRYLDFALKVGASKVAFMACTPVNAFAARETMGYETILRPEDPALLFTRGFQDYEYCRCQDGIYASDSGEIIEFYGRNTDASGCSYCRGLVYGADNHLRSGYEGELLL